MKVISMSKRKFDELEPLKLSSNIFNTEGKILGFSYKNQDKVFKSLYKVEGPKFANKLYTLEMLDNNRDYLPSSFIVPDYLCTVNNEVYGFTMPKFDGVNLNDVLNDNKLTTKEHIYYLKKIGEVLDQLENIRKYTPLKDIYINDLHQSNFMVNLKNRELKVVDLDSCKICNNKISPSLYLGSTSIGYDVKKYKKSKDKDQLGSIIPSANSDIYCYGMVLLKYLTKENVSTYELDEYYEYLNYLNFIGIDKELLDSFSRLVNEYDNTNPGHFLDTLDTEQVARSSYKVYKKAKSTGFIK